MKLALRKKAILAKVRLVVPFAIVTLLVLGCGGINPSRMAPKPPTPPTTTAAKTVRVMDVTGGRKAVFGGAAMINDAQFKKALLLALRQSGLFSAVSEDQGDVTFQATIRSEDQKVSHGLQYTATMTVSYKLTDPAGNTLWSSSFESEFSSTKFSGASRTIEAREGSARENLNSMLRELRTKWPKK